MKDDHYESEDESEHEYGGVTCLDHVRQCIVSNDDHNQCLGLMSQCFTQESSCSDKVVHCIEENKYNIVECYELINKCSHDQEEALGVQDCYGHIEKCYTSTSLEDQDICTSLLPSCYHTTEQLEQAEWARGQRKLTR